MGAQEASRGEGSVEGGEAVGKLVTGAALPTSAACSHPFGTPLTPDNQLTWLTILPLQLIRPLQLTVWLPSPKVIHTNRALAQPLLGLGRVGSQGRALPRRCWVGGASPHPLPNPLPS